MKNTMQRYEKNPYLQEFYISFFYNFTLIKCFTIPFKIRLQNCG